MSFLDELVKNSAGFIASPYALDAGLALALAGLIIGLTRKGFTYHKGALVPRDMGPRWEQTGYGVMILGLVLFASATVVSPGQASTIIYSGGSPFNSRWYCLNPTQTTTQNCGYVSSTNSTLCTTNKGNCGTNNYNSTAITGSVATTSALPVSTGSGFVLKPAATGAILVTANIEAYATGGNTRLNFQVFYSTTGIPAAGTATPGGDVGLPHFYTDPTATTTTYSLAFSTIQTGLTVGTKYFFYMALYSGDGVNTANTGNGGNLAALEV